MMFDVAVGRFTVFEVSIQRTLKYEVCGCGKGLPASGHLMKN